MSTYVLYTLRDLRIDGERQAERTLAEAAAARRRADEETARLEMFLAEAQAARRAARDDAGGTLAESVADAQVRLRFWSRLEAVARAGAVALATHRAGVWEPAAQAEQAARAAHLRARQRREVVDKAIARREAARHLDQSRRAEAAADDLAQRRPK
jgi:flagellar biosynthesis chaperone FliJ